MNRGNELKKTLAGLVRFIALAPLLLIGAFGVAALGLAACAQPELPKDHFYRLNLSPPEAFSSVLLEGVVEVERFSAGGLAAGRPIVYSEAGRPHELLEYHYHFWTEPPTVMLRDRLVEYLRAAKVADTVVTPEMRVRPDHVLTVKIKRLEKIAGPHPKAAVKLEMALRQAGGGKLTFLGSYGVEAKAADHSVAAAVEAINKALGQIYAKFVADLAGR
ncbi:MAG: ABC-type transport auxiliary lipoprotein family protein [Rhodospirillales bacterium]